MKQALIDFLISENIEVKDCGEYLEADGVRIYILLLDNTDSVSPQYPADTNSLFILSDEWGNRAKAILLSKLGKNKRRLQGRECIVKEIDKLTSRDFLDEFHIQGHNNLVVVSFGLYYGYYGEELVGVMTLGRHSRQIAENRIVLDRLCFKAGINVIGGAGKLLSRGIEWAKSLDYDEIISFSDNRWGVGNVYNTLGFELEKEYRPDYFYYDKENKKRLSKQSQKKSSCNCPDTMTEFEWASYRGLVRFYDWGKKRWAYNLKPSERMSWIEARSHQCAEQHKNGVFHHSHIRGYFKSEKNQMSIYYGSSYELRCEYLLENDSNVKSFCRCDMFRGESSWRNPDLLVEYIDGKIEIIEVKPVGMLEESAVQDQIRESRIYANSKGYGFRLWGEAESGFANEKEIVDWAKEYLEVNYGDTRFAEHQKKNRQRISKKHYDEKIKTDTVEHDCKYCNETHIVLRKTYEKAVERKGRYICEREGGHIAGSKKKPEGMGNPLFKDGLKQCRGSCGQIKPLACFSKGKAVCMKCRTEIYKNKYNEKKGRC